MSLGKFSRKKRQLGTEDTPSDNVISGCEQFLCRLMSRKGIKYKTAGELRWICFKNQSCGMESIPPTSGAWRQHILRANWQAFIWSQDIVQHPVIPDPLKMGWSCSVDGMYVPLLSEIPIAPESVIELVKCGCGISKCSRRCTCRENNSLCTEVCKCGADEKCSNTNTNYIDQQVDDDSDEDN